MASDAQKRALRKYIDKSYTRISYDPNKEYAEILKAYCRKKKITMRQFLNSATKEYMGKYPVEKSSD